MKLPITPLLYLVSLASIGGIAHSVYQYSEKTNVYDAEARKKIKAENEKLKAKGVAQTANTERWNYRATSFWRQFGTVNLTGVVEKKPEEKKPEDDKKDERKKEIIQVADILDVICITRAGDDTGIVVKYNTTVDVPAKFVVKASAPSVGSTIPAGRRRGRRTPTPAPTQNIGQAPPHHIRIGEKLWPQYDYIVLKGVAPDASYATFELQIPEKKDKEKGYPSQNVLKGNLDLPPEVLAAMRKGSGEKSTTGGTDTKGGAKTPDGGLANLWVDTPETTVARDGRVNIARKDQQFLENNGRSVFTDDVHMRDYSGGSGKFKIRGVQIRKLSDRVRQYGVNEGDVLISINNIKVTGMANAKKVGRRLYNQGVRNFRAEVLRQGRIITRTYTFKNEKK